MPESSNSTQEFEYHCSECNQVLSEEDQVCPNCGTDVSEIELTSVDNISVNIPSTTTFLKSYADFLEAIGWLIAIAGIAIIVFPLVNSSIELLNVLIGLGVSSFGILIIANAKLILCLLSIENNTKLTASTLVKLSSIISNMKLN